MSYTLSEKYVGIRYSISRSDLIFFRRSLLSDVDWTALAAAFPYAIWVLPFMYMSGYLPVGESNLDYLYQPASPGFWLK